MNVRWHPTKQMLWWASPVAILESWRHQLILELEDLLLPHTAAGLVSEKVTFAVPVKCMLINEVAKVAYLEAVVDFLFYLFLICFGNVLKNLNAFVSLTPLSQPTNRLLNVARKRYPSHVILLRYDILSLNISQWCDENYGGLCKKNNMKYFPVLQCPKDISFIRCCCWSGIWGTLPKYPWLYQSSNGSSNRKPYINYQAPPTHAYAFHNWWRTFQSYEC